MGHKIFVSYKYADDNVKHISENYWQTDTVRTYVDKLSEYIADTSEHIYKGEHDGEDLSKLAPATIWTKLRDRIYDSTLTIVMISKGMRNCFVEDKEQWIPWEISYSLKEPSRKNKNGDPVTSKSNAILAIVIPDKTGSYDYFTYNKTCCSSGCRVLQTHILFNIMKNNMFNIKNPNTKMCDDKSTIFYGDYSYISVIKWDEFIKNPESHIQKAYDIQKNIDNYDITKEV